MSVLSKIYIIAVFMLFFLNLLPVSAFNLKRWFTLTKSGETAYRQGRPQHAEDYFKQALIESQSAGEDNPMYSASIRNLADVYRITSKPDEAQSLYERDIAICEKAELASYSLYYLASIEIDKQLYARAERHLYQALQHSPAFLAGEITGPDQINILAALTHLYVLWGKRQRDATAQQLELLLLSLPPNQRYFRTLIICRDLVQAERSLTGSPKYQYVSIDLLYKLLTNENAVGTTVNSRAVKLRWMSEISSIVNQLLADCEHQEKPGVVDQLFEIEQSLPGRESDPMFCLRLARLYTSYPNYTKAVAAYKRAIDSFIGVGNSDATHFLMALVEYAQLLQQLGETTACERAERQLATWLERRSVSPQSCLQQANKCAGSGPLLDKLRILLYSKVVSAQPSCLTALFERGNARSRIHDLHHAIEDYTKAIALGGDEKYFVARGNAYRQLRDFHHAEQDYLTALRKTPRKAAWVGITEAELFLLHHNYKQAILAYSKAISLGVPWFVPRARLYAIEGDLQKALADYSSAIKVNANDTAAYLGRASLRFAQRKFQDAVSDYTKCISLGQRSNVLYLSRADAYAHLGDHKRALGDYDTAIKLSPADTNGYLKRGGYLMSISKLQESLADISTASRLSPKDSAIFFLRAGIYAKVGMTAAALSDINRAIQINATNADYYIARSNLSTLDAHYNAAEQDCEEALRLNPNCWAAYWGLGSIAQAQGQPTRALAFFNRAINIMPKHAYLYVSRAELYGQRHEFNKGREDFHVASRLSKNDPHIHLRFAKLLHSACSFKEAVDEYSRAIELDPKDVQPYLGRALVFVSIKKEDMAISDYQHVLSLAPNNNEALTSLTRLTKHH